VTRADPDRDVVVERWIAAPPETVFSFFEDPARWLQWQGVGAVIQPRPDGVFRMNVRGDGFASGRFVEVRPPHRIVFTWGWEASDDVPPGSSTVEIDLHGEAEGTRVRLRHRGLPSADSVSQHRSGWEHYLERLVVAASGGDPGRDPTRVDGEQP
jgi:uncharacterized protein YndB with AHSA1/START domain